jgi:hypothetical protein
MRGPAGGSVVTRRRARSPAGCRRRAAPRGRTPGRTSALCGPHVRRTRRRARGSRCGWSCSASGRSRPRPRRSLWPVGRRSSDRRPPARTAGLRCRERSAVRHAARCPRSPRCATRRPARVETNSVLAPRSVPATSSCSEATPSTSPIGDSRRPAVERSVTVRLDAVVVEVLVGDEQQVGLDAGDRGVVPTHAAVEHRCHVWEGDR